MNAAYRAEAEYKDAGFRSDSGALSEIVALGGIAVVAMALLAFGYGFRADPAATSGVNVAPPQATATDRMTDPPLPRANPAEMSQPPTQYPLGSGSPATAPTDPAPPRPDRGPSAK
jgi:hypothetical protein